MIKKQAFLLFLFLSVLAGCKVKKEDTIKVGVLQGPTAISMAYMIENHESFRLADVTYKIYQEPLQLRSAILRDDVDIATIPSVMACNLINNGKDIKIAAIPIWGTLHLFGSEKGISTWQDLRGREIYMMAEGMTPDLIFKALLKANGMVPGRDVQLNYSFQTHEDLANACIAGRAPLAVLSEPLVSRAIDRSDSLFRIFDLNAEWTGQYKDSVLLAQTALIVNLNSQSLTDETLEKFLDIYALSCERVNKDTKYMADFMVKHKILNNKAIAKDAIQACNIKFVRADTISQGILNYFDFIYALDPRLTGAPGNINMIYSPSQKK